MKSAANAVAKTRGPERTNSTIMGPTLSQEIGAQCLGRRARDYRLAWLMLTAKRRAIDMMRRRTLVERKHEKLTADGDVTDIVPTPEYEKLLDTDVPADQFLGLGEGTVLHGQLSATGALLWTERRSRAWVGRCVERWICQETEEFVRSISSGNYGSRG